MAQYTTMEELQELVRQLNSAATLETDNYHALCVQCQDLIAKIEEHSAITNKYGEWFASMYRDMLSEVPGEKNTELANSQTINAVIDFIEGGFDQIAEAKADEIKLGIDNLQAQLDSKQKELDEIENQITQKKSELQKTLWELEECKDNLKQTQINECYARDELDRDTENLKRIQENICYTQYEKQPNECSPKLPRKPPHSSGKDPSPIPAQTQISKPQPTAQPYISSRQVLDTSQMAKSVVNGFTTPNSPASGHLYLCDVNGFIDITRLPEVRRNNLMMLNANLYQSTGKPQFKIETDDGKFYIHEQQQISNWINGHPLQGKHEIKNGDKIKIMDLKGQSFILYFILG